VQPIEGGAVGVDGSVVIFETAAMGGGWILPGRCGGERQRPFQI
jgi:hypothetical protein